MLFVILAQFSWLINITFCPFVREHFITDLGVYTKFQVKHLIPQNVIKL